MFSNSCKCSDSLQPGALWRVANFNQRERSHRALTILLWPRCIRPYTTQSPSSSKPTSSEPIWSLPHANSGFGQRAQYPDEELIRGSLD